MNRDEDILKGLRKNHGDAQRLLLQRHGDMVFSQILRIVSRREDAEEVYQDVFMKVFRSIGGYDPGKASLATWLMRIAYHEALNFARGGKSRSVVFGEWTSDAELMSEAEVDAFFGRTDEETVSLVEQALDRLFFVHGVPGDIFALVMEFEPLPLSTEYVDFCEPSGKPFKAWGASWSGMQFPNLSVRMLRANQKMFGYYEREIVE